MALARCAKCGRPEGITHSYTNSHRPISYPNSGVVCGTKGCRNPAYLWLIEAEEKRYAAGERVFELPTNAVKVRVTLFPGAAHPPSSCRAIMAESIQGSQRCHPWSFSFRSGSSPMVKKLPIRQVAELAEYLRHWHLAAA